MVHLCVIIIYILKCIFGLEKKINSNYIILESFHFFIIIFISWRLITLQ